MKKDDTCYYMSITKEENSAFVVHQNQTSQVDPAQKEGELRLCKKNIVLLTSVRNEKTIWLQQME